MRLTEEHGVGTQPVESHGSLALFRMRLQQPLHAIATFLESHPWVIFAILIALYSISIYLPARANPRPLWYDELFTYYIARAPSFSAMLEQARTLDLNPPLYYVFARLTFLVLHPGSFAARLPSLLAYLAAGCFVYVFVRRRLAPVYGLLSGLVLFGSYYQNYGWEARPYALILAFLGVAAIGWQRATEEISRGRTLSMLLVIVGGFGMLLSHVLASAAYAGFFFAELIRLIQRRRPDWPLWGALLLPLAATGFYIPLLRSHGASEFPLAFQASPLRLAENYQAIWTLLSSLLAAAMMLILLLGKETKGEPAHRRHGFTVPEWAFTAYLLLLPLLITVVFMGSRSAYFDRYGIASAFGLAILIPALIAAWTGASRIAALAAAFVFAFGVVTPAILVTSLENLIHPPREPDFALTGSSSEPLDEVERDLPFVDASGLTFLEMNNREDPEFLSRVYYLTDRQAAAEYSHATIFDDFAPLKKTFPIRANVTPYAKFILTHQKFLVYGTVDYPEDWLLRKLLADGAVLRYLGDFPSSYKDSALYEVTLPQQNVVPG